MASCWEYALVTSLATLLIPFIFLDATKSFATNIIKIFLQYFAKIMVVTLSTFYVLNLMIETGLHCFSDGPNTSALITVGGYIFVGLLGVVFIAGSEKIANILFTGTPTLSMGDIVQGARDVGMAAHAVGGAARGASNMAKGALGAGQAIVRGGQSAAAWGAGLSYIGASLKQGFKDLATKAFTGRDAQHFDENNKRENKGTFHGVGGKNYSQGSEIGTTTYGLAKKNMGEIGKDLGKKAAEKLINPSQKADQSMQKDLDKPNSGVDHLTKSPGS